jgi:hypothetical protein
MSKSRDIADSAATINYIDDLTSAVQSQIDAKSPLSNPTFTGTVAATAFSGDGSALTGVDSLPSQTGNAGEFLTTDGTDASWAAAGGFSNLQVFTSSGTWTIPSGITKCLVYCTGAGGGTTGQNSGSGGGGAAGTAIKIYSLSGATASVTIGSGSAGAAGGNSSFVNNGVTITGNGGNANSSGNGGLSGTASGGDINITGGDGGSRGAAALGLSGGSSYWGGGGRGEADSYTSGQTNKAYGSGAGGSGNSSTASGTDGIVVIYY